MRIPWLRRPLPMRQADSGDADFHLLEHLAKPAACVNAGRVSVWVYHHGGRIREIVLSGHAESGTCSRATSILIEATKELDEKGEWMLTCGAAYFRLSEAEASRGGRAGLPGLEALLGLPGGAAPSGNQAVLGKMVGDLQELAEQSGLVDVYHRDWRVLGAFREKYRGQMKASPPLIVLPAQPGAGRVADYMPILPRRNPDAGPLVFRLEGWDFDCPEYQQVADHHLHSMCRQLLRDAMLRRQTYRGWLKEWTEEWVRSLHWLPGAEAAQVCLIVPPSADEPDAADTPMTAGSFLEDQVASFLDRSQAWHRPLLAGHKAWPFGRMAAETLDEKIHPKLIVSVDFERGFKTERTATDEDRPFTRRERVSQNDPQMISQCLRYIRRMDAIIKPYEQLRLRGRQRRRNRDAESESKDRKLEVLSDINSRIVLETMIRGWPSIYLQDEGDREVFQRWADKVRPHVWSIMTEQAKQAGVAAEVLLEDNVIYEVRFNDDLGCTVQPLMLADDAVHAQVHGARNGASAVVPLWPRTTTRPMGPEVMGLGQTNTQRAAQLVRQASQHAAGPNPSVKKAARLMQLALACHPGQAGQGILGEWARRLGRDTSGEFTSARSIVEAAELCARSRYAEAGEQADRYLETEPDPISDAYVISAVCKLVGEDQSPAKLREAVFRRNSLVKPHNELVEELQKPSRLQPALRGEMVEKARRLESLREKIQRLDGEIQALEAATEQAAHQRRKLVEQALAKPASVRSSRPELAQAARKAPEALRATLETDCLYYPTRSEAMFLRYGGIRSVIEAQGLFDMLFELGRIQHRIEQDPKRARLEALDRMALLARNIWLPEAVESDLKMAAEEFAKGDWDRLQANQICAILREAGDSCAHCIRDRINDPLMIHSTMAEAAAMRICIMQLVGHYRTVLEMLLTARVPLGRAVSQPWTVLDAALSEFPAEGSLAFDEATGTVCLQSPAGRKPILRAEHLSADERAYLAEVVSDPELPQRGNPYARCLAERLLGAEVEPRPEWRLWRDAMREAQNELLVAISYFEHLASLRPQPDLQPSQKALEARRRMDEVPPRQAPLIDWDWSRPDRWRPLLGEKVRRISGQVY